MLYDFSLLRPGVWFILFNVLCALGKNMYFAILDYNTSYMSINQVCQIDPVFRASVPY